MFRADTPKAALDAVRAAIRPAEDVERVAVSVIGLWPEDVGRLSKGDPLWRERYAVPLLGPVPALLRSDSSRAAAPRRRNETTG